MLERQTRSFDDLLQDHNLVSLEHKRTFRRESEAVTTCREPSPKQTLDDSHTMTRKTRTRRPRIAVIQSGYCAVCNLHYNNVEDHIQSKKHQKLIGEDANYIALNGSLNGFLDSNGIPFLNLNGIEAIGVHDSTLEDFSSPKYKRRNMSKARSVRETSVAPDKTKSTDNDIAGHHLRSRRNINYMTPPSEDDSFLETPDLNLPEPTKREFKEYRELRSSTRALAKLTEQLNEGPQEELWNSGRPKRTCLKRKLSLEDRPSRAYYKVEMVNPKSKSSQKEKEANHKRQQSQSPKHEDDKGLIVKFKKMRNSELVQLNNEATNFLFPKKEVTNEGEDFNDEIKKTESDKTNQNTGSVLSEDSHDSKRFKYEDDASMDSSCSNGKKKKRRTHAEAFIMDNQKYYKFETPGSRLRYQGSYLPPLVKSTKSNGQCPPNTATGGVIKMEEPEEKVKKVPKLELDKYGFSFEMVPENASWYQAFQRLDRGEQRYFELPNHSNDDFILPYQMSRITPLDPQLCIQAYKQVLKFFQSTFSASETDAASDTVESDDEESSTTVNESTLDEDSKLSVASSSFSVDKDKKGGGGKNPRKSPRQHASTLAILSSLIHQRRRRSKGRLSETLPTITEESTEDDDKDKAKVDYVSLAQTIEDELDMALDDELEEHTLFIEEPEDTIDFHNSKTTVAEIMKLFEEEKAKETGKTCKRFFNGGPGPGRKPGRKRKKNLTGWPNSKHRKSTKVCRVKDNNTSSDSSVNNDSDAEEVNSTDSFKQCADSYTNNNRVNRNRNKVLTNKVTNEVMQPFVYVQKLDNKEGEKKTSKKTLRRVSASPRSPRVLRKPRGRWYRER